MGVQDSRLITCDIHLRFCYCSLQYDEQKETSLTRWMFRTRNKKKVCDWFKSVNLCYDWFILNHKIIGTYIYISSWHYCSMVNHIEKLNLAAMTLNITLLVNHIEKNESGSNDIKHYITTLNLTVFFIINPHPKGS